MVAICTVVAESAATANATTSAWRIRTPRATPVLAMLGIPRLRAGEPRNPAEEKHPEQRGRHGEADHDIEQTVANGAAGVDPEPDRHEVRDQGRAPPINTGATPAMSTTAARCRCARTGRGLGTGSP